MADTDTDLELLKMAELGKLCAGIVHEINTPVGSILSNNEVLRRSLEILKKKLDELARATPLPPKIGQIVESMTSLTAVDQIACERILAMVRSVKTFARADEGLSKARVNDLIQDTLKLTAASYRGRITVETHFGELSEIVCHASLLMQVFLNLVTNAAQAIEGEGRIIIRTAEERGCVIAEFSDTGRGIREEDRPKIFQRGFTTKPVGQGTGLGLAFSKDVVENRHGGSLSFECEPGAGTTFRVALPLAQPNNKTGE